MIAVTDPTAGKKGISAFIVPTSTSGYIVAKVEEKMGQAASDTCAIMFDNCRIPASHRLGQEGEGYKIALANLESGRIGIAAQALGMARAALECAVAYAKERVVFGRPIGQNQGVQFPIAEAHIEVEAADLMRWRACQEYDAGLNAGASANMAKYLAAKASWEAANACLQTHGGFGFAEEYDIERKFRETRLYQVAPISTNMIYSYVAEHILGLPRSF